MRKGVRPRRAPARARTTPSTSTASSSNWVPAFSSSSAQRGVHVERLAVVAPAGHRPVRVAHGHDPGGHRDPLVRKAVRVAAAVGPLVVEPDDERHRLEARARAPPSSRPTPGASAPGAPPRGRAGPPSAGSAAAGAACPRRGAARRAPPPPGRRPRARAARRPPARSRPPRASAGRCRRPRRPSPSRARRSRPCESPAAGSRRWWWVRASPVRPASSPSRSKSCGLELAGMHRATPRTACRATGRPRSPARRRPGPGARLSAESRAPIRSGSVPAAAAVKPGPSPRGSTAIHAWWTPSTVRPCSTSRWRTVPA